MDQEQIIERIRAHRDRLTELGVASLSLFGSVARGEATEASDVDLLVTNIAQPVRLFENRTDNPGHWLTVAVTADALASA